MAQHGEVFTNPREVDAMLGLVRGELFRLDSRFLEPVCGGGNSLIEILRCKLPLLKNLSLIFNWFVPNILCRQLCAVVRQQNVRNFLGSRIAHGKLIAEEPFILPLVYLLFSFSLPFI